MIIIIIIISFLPDAADRLSVSVFSHWSTYATVSVVGPSVAVGTQKFGSPRVRGFLPVNHACTLPLSLSLTHTHTLALSLSISMYATKK
jgi:hypothetical protein